MPKSHSADSESGGSASSSPTRHLVYLRRYARALLGSQKRGDRYVRLCLETLIEDDSLLKGAADIRVALYRMFHSIVSEIDPSQLSREREEVSALHALETNVMALPPVERQVLLLTAVEGFTLEEAAEVLDLESEEAERLLAAAREMLEEQTLTSVLVIEDEPIIALDIADIVSEMGHDVTGVAATHAEAVALAKERAPGIVLADIQLGDGGSGIEAVGDILRSMDVPVVFVTAYPEYLLTGEGQEPAYLVTKPFEPDELKVTIYQALLSRQSPDAADAV